jgi:CubicO group peptidase (beta-lactamase class C family)
MGCSLPPDTSHNEDIHQVERGLRPAAVAADAPVPQWSLHERMNRWNVPGASIAVIDDGALAWARGYGVLEAGGADSVTARTRFQSASISKPVAAFAALRLVGDGALALDAPVNRHLRMWPVPENEFTRDTSVTLRGLLSHTAGTTVSGFPGYPAGDSIPSLVQVLNGAPPANTPPIRVDTRPGTTMLDSVLLKTPMRFLLLILLSLSLSLPATAAPPDTSLANRLDTLMPELLERYQIPGAAVAVIRGGEVVKARGYGFTDAEYRTPMTAETVLKIGSISKPVAAWGVMTLVEAGRIDLDVPINRYLDRLQLTSDTYDADGVTVRRILNHTSGLARGSYPGYKPGSTPPDLIAALKGEVTLPPGLAHEARLVAASASTFAYSNTAYSVLDALVEDVTGQSFPDYLRTAVLEPLGMRHSAFGWPDSVRQHAAAPHNMWSDTEPIRRATGNAYGNLNATIADFARWAAASVDAATAPRGRGVLPLATIDTMLTAGRGDWGLGYEVETLPDGTELWGHSGWSVGWMARFHVDPATGHGLVVLTNADPYGFMVTRGAHCAWVKQDYGVSFDRFCQQSALGLTAAAFHDTTATAAIDQVRAQVEANPDAIYIDETEFYVLGERLLEHRNVHHTIEVFRWNLELHPDAWQAHYYLGEAHAQAGDTQEAIRRFERSLELNPEHPFVTRRLDTIRN